MVGDKQRNSVDTAEVYYIAFLQSIILCLNDAIKMCLLNQ